MSSYAELKVLDLFSPSGLGYHYQNYKFMHPRNPPGGVFKNTSNLLLVVGALLLSAGLLSLVRSKQRTIVPAPSTTLAKPKETIPRLVKQIYAGLNEGRPSDIRSLLSPTYFENSKNLDSICQPFNYRTHYIASIVEAPRSTIFSETTYVARVHTLYKTVGERATLMYFKSRSAGEELYLSKNEHDPLVREKQAAQDVIRMFIFAARAGQWDVIKKLSSPKLPFEELKQYEWQHYLAGIRNVDLQTTWVHHNGIKIESRLIGYDMIIPDGRGGKWPFFLVDSLASGRVVAAFYTTNLSRETSGLVDYETEAYTLRRFKIKGPLELR
jgi:hypothetical protein